MPLISSNELHQELTQTIERARADPAAFRPVYEAYFPRIYRYCLRRVGCPQEAEDLASQVFTSALAALADYRGGSLAAWLFRIAHNAVANHLRGRRVTVPLEGIDRPDEGDEMVERLVDLEERQCVERLIAALPDDQRELLALRVAGGLSAKDIAQVMNKSEGAVRVAIHRIVQQLRLSFAREEAR